MEKKETAKNIRLKHLPHTPTNKPHPQISHTHFWPFHFLSASYGPGRRSHVNGLRRCTLNSINTVPHLLWAAAKTCSTILHAQAVMTAARVVTSTTRSYRNYKTVVALLWIKYGTNTCTCKSESHYDRTFFTIRELYLATYFMICFLWHSVILTIPYPAVYEVVMSLLQYVSVTINEKALSILCTCFFQ